MSKHSEKSTYRPTHCPPKSQESVPSSDFNSTVCVLPPTRSEGTVIFLSFRTDRSVQTVQTQIRLLLEQSDQGLHCLPFCLHRLHSLLHGRVTFIICTHYSMVESHCSNFRVITIIFLGVRIFRKFTVDV